MPILVPILVPTVMRLALLGLLPAQLLPAQLRQGGASACTPAVQATGALEPLCVLERPTVQHGGARRRARLRSALALGDVPRVLAPPAQPAHCTLHARGRGVERVRLCRAQRVLCFGRLETEPLEQGHISLAHRVPAASPPAVPAR